MLSVKTLLKSVSKPESYLYANSIYLFSDETQFIKGELLLYSYGVFVFKNRVEIKYGYFSDGQENTVIMNYQIPYYLSKLGDLL